jgi:hypothetical protein
MFRAHRAHHQDSQVVSTHPMVTVTLCRWPCRVQVGSGLPTRTLHGHRQQTKWELPEVVLTQLDSPDDEHDVLETCRVKNKNKYTVKNCASRWSFSKNHNMMHSQQNVKLPALFSLPLSVSKLPPVLTIFLRRQISFRRWKQCTLLLVTIKSRSVLYLTKRDVLFSVRST